MYDFLNKPSKGDTFRVVDACWVGDCGAIVFECVRDGGRKRTYVTQEVVGELRSVEYIGPSKVEAINAFELVVNPPS